MMVIGDRFAWAHMPKTAGYATIAMFEAFDGLACHADSPDGEDAHVTFRDRLERLDGKLLVLNLRRLPAWVVSRAHYVSLHGVHPHFDPIPIASADELADSSLPDERLALFTDEGRIEIDRWLRVESLAADVVALVSELRDVSDHERGRVTAVGRLNALDYDHEVSSWFTSEQLERLYRNNPAWAALEARLYREPVAVG